MLTIILMNIWIRRWDVGEGVLRSGQRGFQQVWKNCGSIRMWCGVSPAEQANQESILLHRNTSRPWRRVLRNFNHWSIGYPPISLRLRQQGTYIVEALPIRALYNHTDKITPSSSARESGRSRLDVNDRVIWVVGPLSWHDLHDSEFPWCCNWDFDAPEYTHTTSPFPCTLRLPLFSRLNGTTLEGLNTLFDSCKPTDSNLWILQIFAGANLF